MKKNNMLRIASVLLVAVLLSTCAISGAFAKYITVSDPSADSASVAKWGVTITPTSTAFGTMYDGAVTDVAADATVKSNVKVVAPGTNGTVSTLTIAGTPEVDVKVTYEATLELTGWEYKATPESSAEEYCPIVFNIGGDEYKIGENGITDIAGLINAVETAIEGDPQSFDAGTSLATATAESIAWAWAIDVDDDKDTYLGDRAAAGNAATISLQIKATVEQAN